MFHWIGSQTYRHRYVVIGVWLLLLVIAVPFALRAHDPLKVGGFSSPDIESARARALLEERLNLAPSQVVLIYQSDTLRANDPEFLQQVEASLANVRTLPSVTEVVLPSDDPNMISRDGTVAYTLVGLDLPGEQAQREVPAFEAGLVQQPDLTIIVAGGPKFYADIETVSQRDLQRAEVIALPFALVALLVVFGSVVAAAVPLLVGAAGVATILFIVYALAHATDLSIFVLNLATMLGLGLAIDYSLFITSRFREELERHPRDLQRAVERTIATAGKAVFFSGLTVLIGLSGLTLFSFMFLRSVGIAGVIVVACSVLASLTLLPAVLGILGHGIDRGRIPLLNRLNRPDVHHEGFWSNLARRVMARPVLFLVPTLTFLVLLGLPFLHVNVSSPDGRILPRDLASRQGFDILSEKFGEGEISPIVIAFTSPTNIQSDENLTALYEVSQWLSQDPRVVRVQSAISYGPGLSRDEAVAALRLRQLGEIAGLDTRLDRLISDRTAAMLVYTNAPANDDSNKDLVAELRELPLGGDLSLMVTGGTAEIVDVVDRMYGDFPQAVLLVVTATYIILFMQFRSVLLPAKAILMNTLSILASYGALVWIFQEGHLSSLLRFDPQGYVESSLPVIMFCVLFGLSMDYEVFLLSRIREEWDRTGDNTTAVSIGLQRSGRVITSAALIVVVVTASFVSADVIIVKALGVGIALAVFLDATIVRALIVPSMMRLLGHWNWWVPDWLERIVPRRIFLEELPGRE